MPKNPLDEQWKLEPENDLANITYQQQPKSGATSADNTF